MYQHKTVHIRYLQTVIFPRDAWTLSTGNTDIWQEISKILLNWDLSPISITVFHQISQLKGAKSDINTLKGWCKFQAYHKCLFRSQEIFNGISHPQEATNKLMPWPTDILSGDKWRLNLLSKYLKIRQDQLISCEDTPYYIHWHSHLLPLLNLSWSTEAKLINCCSSSSPRVTSKTTLLLVKSNTVEI